MTPDDDTDRARTARIRELERELARLRGQWVERLDEPRRALYRGVERALAAAGASGSERMLADLAALLERDERAEYAMCAARDGLWDWHLPSDRIYFSPSYLRMLGYEPGELPETLATFEHHFVLAEDAERVMAQYRNALEADRPYINLEYRLRHRRGHSIWVYARAILAERDAQGRPRRLVGTNADITDFIHSQEQLLEAKAEVDRANRTKSQFLARMSHEIRTPMNAIVGLGHLLADTELTARQQSYLESMSAAADSLTQQLDQLLDFARIERGRITLENTHFDLDKVFVRLARRFEARAEADQVDMIYDLRPDVPRFLRGDPNRLEQVIGNLLDNALSYSDSRRILVKVKNKRQTSQHITLQFAIVDYGKGMGEAQIARLQKKLHHPHSDGEEAGFGLSICHHLVALMHGQIHMESKAERGCTILFTARFEHSQMGARDLREQTQRYRRVRTLIVDDDPLAREALQRTAQNLQLRTRVVTDAADALSELHSACRERDPYQLVLMDYRLPGENGLAACARIAGEQQLQPAPATVLISSHRRDEVFADGQQLALVDAFVRKPVSESRLFDALNSAFGEPAGGEPREALSPADAGAALTDEPAQVRLECLRVLLVEDNAVNQQVAAGLLRKKGVQVTLAEDGHQALAALAAEPDGFDAILMDVEMPGLDGLETTRRIRAGELAPRIPIIALTAQAVRDDRQRCLEAGMDDYLSKPIKPWLLYRQLAQVVGSCPSSSR